MTASTYKQYAAMLNLFSGSDYDLKIIKAGETISLEDPNGKKASGYASDVQIEVIRAKHRDMLSDRDAVGYILKDQQKNFALVYTGDTGYNADMDQHYREIKEKLKDQQVFLLAHLGGFKRYEKPNFGKTLKENERYFYRNHLGRVGLAKLIEALEPDVCAISEFGEEFLRERCKLTDAFNAVYGPKTFFLAADIGLCLNTEGKMKAITNFDLQTAQDQKSIVLTKDFISPKDAAVLERRVDASLHYYDKNLQPYELIQTLDQLYYT
jgi:hypothetical protein